MPQNSLFQEHLPPSALRLDLFGPNLALDRDQTDLWVYAGHSRLDFQCVAHHPLPGVETDYLNTIVEAAAYAWAYGEGRRDIARAVADVKRLAQAHRRSHSRA